MLNEIGQRNNLTLEFIIPWVASPRPIGAQGWQHQRCDNHKLVPQVRYKNLYLRNILLNKPNLFEFEILKQRQRNDSRNPDDTVFLSAVGTTNIVAPEFIPGSRATTNHTVSQATDFIGQAYVGGGFFFGILPGIKIPGYNIGHAYGIFDQHCFILCLQCIGFI